MINWPSKSTEIFNSDINPPSPNSLQEQIQDIIDHHEDIQYGQWYIKEIQALEPSDSTEAGYISLLSGLVVYQLSLNENFSMINAGVPYYIANSDMPENGCTIHFCLTDENNPLPTYP